MLVILLYYLLHFIILYNYCITVVYCITESLLVAVFAHAVANILILVRQITGRRDSVINLSAGRSEGMMETNWGINTVC